MEKFKVGDQVKVLHSKDIWLDDHDLPHDTVFKVIEADPNCDDMVNAKNLTIEIEALEDWGDDFEVVSRKKEEVTTLSSIAQVTADEALGPTRLQLNAELGVYRPNLEDRKVGKVPMHMVIDGFPLALEHVAEIMGWAAEKKGYKLHDWRNLPEAEIAFPSAGYRHMTDNSKMKAKGLKAIDRVDHESAKLHIGHQIFNLLAELELVLRGDVK
ncbi:hypothetical protein vBPpSSYP_71 [Pseudomonas phage vB_PpS_SYP]|nr:hypothetical protein vBPpSSYP_71 [Pseudomonas phage vB_PpS_SYP]